MSALAHSVIAPMVARRPRRNRAAIALVQLSLFAGPIPEPRQPAPNVEIAAPAQPQPPKRVRPKTIARRTLEARAERERVRRAHQLALAFYDAPFVRQLPLSRDECRDGERPCPFVTCRFNLYLDVTDFGSLKLNFPDREPDEMDPDRSCALDVADACEREGQGLTLEKTGDMLSIKFERIRQIEIEANKKLRRKLKDSR